MINKCRVFAVTIKDINQINDHNDVPHGSVVEIILGKKGGFSEFVLSEEHEKFPIIYNGTTYLSSKNCLKEFSVVNDTEQTTTQVDPVIKYIEAMNGSWGCVARYDKEIAGDWNGRLDFAFLAGHYNCLLDKVIDIVGKEKLKRLIEAQDEIDGRCKKPSE